MAFSMDEQWVYGGQLIVSAPFITPQALGIGPAKIDHSVYLQGPVQHGAAGNFGESVATTMIGRSDTVETPRALHTRGNVRIEGDGDTTSAINVTGGASHAGYFKGGSPDAVYIDGDLYVTGATDCGNKGRLASRFAAADASPKPFDIKHPSKDGWRLRYACIEGPEVGVYYRGRLRNQTQIALPYYWKDLVNTQSISVQIQPIRAHQDIIVKRWDAEKVEVQAKPGFPINCFYHVYAERKDINPLITEYEGESWQDYPDPNYDPRKTPDGQGVFNDPAFAGPPNTVTM